MATTHDSGTSSILEPVENGTSASWFLDELFGCASEYESGIRACLFEGRNDRTTRFALDELYKADAFVETRRDLGPIYFNTGLQNLPLRCWARGERGEVYAITSLSADLDLFKEDADKKYPTFDVAMATLEEMPLAPSLIVFSGRGLYPLWLLHEPIVVGNDRQVADELARQLTKAWQAMLLRRLQENDATCTMDSTGDLTRMLRVPGSFHAKAGRTVVVIRSSHLRYDREDFAPFLPEPLSTVSPRNGRAITLRADRERIDIERTGKFQALLANDVRFSATWLHNRPEFCGDASRYCMSLTDAAVRTGWTDEEIDDLRFVWCNKHGHESSYQLRKSLHDIGKKRAEIAEEEPVRFNNGEATTAPCEFPLPAATQANERESALATIRKAFRHDGLVRVVQRGVERATFDLVFFHQGEEVIVNVGRAKDVFTLSVVQAAVAERLHHTVKSRAKARWEPVAAAIFRAAEVVHKTTAAERLTDLLAAFGGRARGSRSFVDIDPADLPLQQTSPGGVVKPIWPEAFLAQDGRLFISLLPFVTYINSSFLGERLSQAEVAEELSRHGFERCPIQRRVAGKNEKRRYWAGMLPDITEYVPKHPNELRTPYEGTVTAATI